MQLKIISDSLVRIYNQDENTKYVTIVLPKAQSMSKTVGIFTGFFDPFHLMHAYFAMKVIESNILSHVVFMPTESDRKPNATNFDTRYKKLKEDTSFFKGFFSVDNLKRGLSNVDCVKFAISKNYGIDLAWIAEGSGISIRRIANKIHSGVEAEKAFESVISPYIGQYIVFYREIGEDLQTVKDGLGDKLQLIKIPEFLGELAEIRSTDIREGRIFSSLSSDIAGNPVFHIKKLNS